MALGDFTGKKPKDTYDSILHVEGNDNITAALQYISDGLGNVSTVRISTLGTEISNPSLIGTVTLGSPLALTYGGLGASLSDPGSDHLIFWDDSAGSTAFLQLGSNLSITGTTLNSSAPAGAIVWNAVAGTSQTASANNGYICQNGALTSITLPASFAVGDIIRIAGVGAGGWTIVQGAGQQILFHDMSSTVGAGGSLSSTHRRDAIELLGVVADLEMIVLSSVGNITIV